MSRFLEVVLGNIDDVHGLVEVKVDFAGELSSYDPPRYAFDALQFELVPIPRHVRQALPHVLQSSSHCLEMSESLVLAWGGSCLSADDQARLRGFFGAVARQHDWAVVFESDAGQAQRRMGCSPVDLFECIDDCLTRQQDAGLVIFHGASGDG
jgi:hypothetical protein